MGALRQSPARLEKPFTKDDELSFQHFKSVPVDPSLAMTDPHPFHWQGTALLVVGFAFNYSSGS